MYRILIKNLSEKILNPFFIMQYFFIAALLYSIVFFINYYSIVSKMTEYFQIDNRYSSILEQYSSSNSDLYQTAIEISSNIFNYENTVLGNFFAVELWDCNKCVENDYPLFETNNFQLSKIKNSILKKINSNSKNFFVHNNQMYVAIIIPIQSKLKKYNLILYKKIFDLKILNSFDFYTVSIIFLILLYIFSITVFYVPSLILFYKNEKNLEKKVIISVKNLIEHSLINQENILKYGSNLKEKISKSLYHNMEAQTLLKNVHHEDIEIIDFLNSLIQHIYCPNDIGIFCHIELKNKLIFSKNLLLFAFSTIIYNAIHPSVNAKNILLDIQQKKFRNEVTIKISNDGEEISQKNKKRIFSGVTTKKDGHGLGLKNLKNLLQEAGSSLKLLKIEKTTFSFNVKTSSSKNPVHQKFKLEKKDHDLEVIKTEAPNFVSRENRPFVIIIEDEPLIWDAWKLHMHDATILFFKNPNDFFFHCDVEKYNKRNFISKIEMIICDFDFGNGNNIANSGIFNSLEKEEEIFKGYFVLCSGYNESIMKEIPKKIVDKIDFFFQKIPCSYEAIVNKIKRQGKI